MPQLVGFENSTFDVKRYRLEVCDNHGGELTTEGVCAGIASVAADYDAEPSSHWLTSMKETPFYISSKG
jgi:hypothetical protein